LSERQKILISIVGPTAIGKTTLAIKVAQHFQTEIISADSRQFYKEMSIGTAKPNAGELAQAKHHFIDSHFIHDNFNVGDYEKTAIAKIEDLFKQHDVLVLVGGSGLYINAVLFGFDELPKADEALRTSLNQQFANEGIESLQNQLEKLDPIYYKEVDIQNPQRIIRALEVCISTGKPFSSFRKTEPKNRSFQSIVIGLDMEREKLYERVNLRVDQMIAEGLVEEATSLKAFQDLNALKTVGYSEIFQYLNGYLTLSEAIDKIKQNTRNFAKRQLTWFRKNQDVNWFEPNQEIEILQTIQHQLDLNYPKKFKKQD
jgi:tRNA dimethylallyltransferase